MRFGNELNNAQVVWVGDLKFAFGIKDRGVCGMRRFYTAAEVKISDAEKRSRSKIKDKEKVKRMKGQSSHATWKSETEMQLRQQFD